MSTSKKRFIVLHGEEAWKEKLKREMASKRRYKENNREKIKEAGRQYYSTHKKEYADSQKEYMKTPQGRAKSMLANYKKVDKESGTGECTLTQKWILDNIFASSCTYCGESDWRKLGCDRIDNNLPHTQENCVCACLSCNAQRSNRWTVEEFVEYKKKGDPLKGPPIS
jgi:hypothetical protein